MFDNETIWANAWQRVEDYAQACEAAAVAMTRDDDAALEDAFALRQHTHAALHRAMYELHSRLVRPVDLTRH